MKKPNLENIFLALEEINGAQKEISPFLGDGNVNGVNCEEVAKHLDTFSLHLRSATNLLTTKIN